MLNRLVAVALVSTITFACSDGEPSGAAVPMYGGGAADGVSAERGGPSSGGGEAGGGETAEGGMGAADTGDVGGGQTGGTESGVTVNGGVMGSGGSASSAGGSGSSGSDGGGSGGGGSGGSAMTGVAGSDVTPDEVAMEWLPSWATTIQSTEPNNLPPALGGNTLRQFVWPTVSGSEIRIQLSNEKGSSPVAIQKVHVALANTGGDPGNSNGQIDPATDVAFSFGGGEQSVTIPAGETVWSDPLLFELEEIRLTAVTMQFGQSVPPEITGHPGARTTSYVGTGDQVASQGIAGAQTRDRWYFINAIEVMAPADSFAIAVLGDSITDGYGVLNRFARWTDFLTLAIKEDPNLATSRSVLNFGMGANNLTVSGQYQDAGVVRFERDVLTRDKIKWLIVLEGINDIVYSNVQAQPIKDAYAQIIQRAQAAGILVYGSPILPTNQGSAAIRNDVNNYVRTMAPFDAVLDLDRAVDPNNAGTLAQQFNNDGLHPNDAGYEAMANAVDLTLFYDDTLE